VERQVVTDFRLRHPGTERGVEWFRNENG
jgi:hypothetical protein